MRPTPKRPVHRKAGIVTPQDSPGGLTYGSLFSGIGGLDLGLDRSGWTCRWQVEKNSYRRRVLETHWPGIRRYEDIREVNFEEVEQVDLVAGGFPCQPVSTAGKRLAQQDPRWLWPEFARAVRILRPRFVLVENVPGLLVRGFGDVLGDLAALGYDAEWEEFPAAAVGAPHLRYRVFIVAYSNEVSNTNGHRRGRRSSQHESMEGSEATTDTSKDGAHRTMAHTNGRRRAAEEDQPESERVVFSRSEFDRICARLRRDWPAEPELGRVAYGVPNRVERCEGVGDAVVPQQAQVVGELLKALALDRFCRNAL